MREILKLLSLLIIPAFVFALGITYLIDRNKFRQDLERHRPQVIAERLLAAGKTSLSEGRAIEIAPKIGFAAQLQRDVSELSTGLDKAVRKSLRFVLGFSEEGADLALSILSWIALGWLGLMVLITGIHKFGPIELRQRLVTGGSGVSARSAGSFELPH